MSTPAEKAFLHGLVVRYYGEGKIKQRERERCIVCGQVRVLGKRLPGKGKCKKCRKEGVDNEC
jgi:hypothetical protein